MNSDSIITYMTSNPTAEILDILPSEGELDSLGVALCLSISKKLFS